MDNVSNESNPTTNSGGAATVTSLEGGSPSDVGGDLSAGVKEWEAVSRGVVAAAAVDSSGLGGGMVSGDCKGLKSDGVQDELKSGKDIAAASASLSDVGGDLSEGAADAAPSDSGSVDFSTYLKEGKAAAAASYPQSERGGGK